MYPSQAVPFSDRDYAAIRNAARYSISASVATEDNAIAALPAARWSGVSSATGPIAGISKASLAKKLTAVANSVIGVGHQRPS